MITLDESRREFVKIARESMRLIAADAGFGALVTHQVSKQASAQWSLVVAAVRHVTVMEERLSPASTAAIVTIREAICRPSGAAARGLSTSADEVFYWLRQKASKHESSVLAIDAMSAVGWTANTVLALMGGAESTADDAARNTLDAVLRIAVLTGIGRIAIGALHTELLREY